MIKSFVLALCLFPLLALAQKGFTINGYLNGLGNNNIRIYHMKNGRPKLDTISPVEKDHFVWKGILEEPELIRIDVIDTMLYLKVGKAVSMPPPIMFMLTNAAIEIRGDANEIYKASLKSDDPEMMIYETYRKEEINNVKATWEFTKIINRKLIESDTLGKAQSAIQLKALRGENQQMRIRYIDAHPASFASALMLNNLSLVMSAPDMRNRYNTLADNIKDSKFGRELLAKIESNLSTAIGKPMINFSQAGYDDKMINTADLKGKVILIDFWGSWCGPCRNSHPGLKKIYEKYHDQGLEIIGISNEAISGNKTKEEQIKSWQKAIKDDGLPWLQLLYDPTSAIDLVKKFDIAGYPTKFIVGRDGKFASRILGFDKASETELEKKIIALLAN